ncbi:hypothetical protein [Candidatus Paracaedibacter symbiosus]|nr:hypothetical protein [Candidatus Paracaedibacter symbiosus]
MENIEINDTEYGITLVASASTLTQGSKGGDPSEGSGAYYTYV